MSKTQMGLTNLRPPLVSDLNRARHDNAEAWTHALASADELREHVAHWQVMHDITVEPVEDTLQRFREGQDDRSTALN